MTMPARDFRGYGRSPPHPHWPGQARIAININLNFEAGGERSMMEGDGTSESALTDTGFPAYPGKRFPGKVTALADAIDPATRTVKVRGTVANAERLLKAEMLATAHVQRRHSDGVVVPASAVLLRGDKHWVFVSPKPGVFEPREVEQGAAGAQQIVLKRGLQAGEQVVTENALLLDRQLGVAQANAQPGPAAPAAQP